MSQAKWSPRIERARFSLGNPLDKLLTRVHVSGGDSSVNPRYHESFTASPQARGQSVARDGWYHGLMERRLILLSKESRLRRWWNPLFLAFLVLPVLPQPNHFSAKVSTDRELKFILKLTSSLDNSGFLSPQRQISSEFWNQIYFYWLQTSRDKFHLFSKWTLTLINRFPIRIFCKWTSTFIRNLWKRNCVE